MTMRLALLGVSLALLLQSGCLVEGISYCQSQHDCTENLWCNPKSHTCELECAQDTDCWEKGKPGWNCIDNRCQLPGERVKAQNFCLEVVNPKSSYYEKDLCLEELKGKVVLIFFALMV
jgi:hypothetical protein